MSGDDRSTRCGRATAGRASRRAVLAGLAALAGCGGPATSDSPTSTATPTRTATPTPSPRPEPVRLGYIFPLAGTFSTYGRAYADAVELALDDVESAGGPLGRPVERHGKDNKGNGSLDRDRFGELVEADVAGFVHFSTAYSLGSIDRRAAEHRVTELFNVSAGVHGVGRVDGTKYVGQTGPDRRADGTGLGVCLGDDRFAGAETAAFLHPDYLEETVALAEAAFPGTAVGSVAFDPHRDDGDYSEVLERLFAFDPDAVGCVPHPDGIGAILEQWADGDYGGEWAFAAGGSLARYRAVLGERAPTMYRVEPAPERADGWERFRERHPSPDRDGAAAAYDAAMLLALAVEHAGEATSTAVAGSLRAVSRPPGTAVTVGEFDRARELLAAGEAVDYRGAAGRMDLTPALTPLVRCRVERATAETPAETVGHVAPDRLHP